MERLQIGQHPRLTHISLEQTLQKVCPHGIKAAPLFLSMQTQHTQSFSSSCFCSCSLSLLLLSLLLFFFLQSTPSVSSIKLINVLTFESPKLRSAANAIARFIPAPGAAAAAPPPLWAWFCMMGSSSSSCSISIKGMVGVALLELQLVLPQQLPRPLNESRCFRFFHAVIVISSKPGCICTLCNLIPASQELKNPCKLKLKFYHFPKISKDRVKIVYIVCLRLHEWSKAL